MPSSLDPSPSPTLDDVVSSIIAGMDSPTPSFAALLDEIHRSGYCGPLTLHFQHGRPLSLEFPRPSITLKLT